MSQKTRIDPRVTEFHTGIEDIRNWLFITDTANYNQERTEWAAHFKWMLELEHDELKDMFKPEQVKQIKNNAAYLRKQYRKYIDHYSVLSYLQSGTTEQKRMLWENFKIRAIDFDEKYNPDVSEVIRFNDVTYKVPFYSHELFDGIDYAKESDFADWGNIFPATIKNVVINVVIKVYK